MELKLYSTSDGENVIHKVKVLKDTISFKAKSDQNIVNPVLKLRFTDVNLLFDSNYAEIPEFERFYFIRTIQNVSNDVWMLHLESDVLESFKHEFLSNTVQVSRNLKSGDFYNASLETEIVKEIDMYDSEITLAPDKNIILSTIGVG